MGCNGNRDLISLFSGLAMPATREELGSTPGHDLGFRVFETCRRNVIEDGERFWLKDDLIAEAITKLEDEIAERQSRLAHWQAQRDALAARFVAPQEAI